MERGGASSVFAAENLSVNHQYLSKQSAVEGIAYVDVHGQGDKEEFGGNFNTSSIFSPFSKFRLFLIRRFRSMRCVFYFTSKVKYNCLY